MFFNKAYFHVLFFLHAVLTFTACELYFESPPPNDPVLLKENDVSPKMPQKQQKNPVMPQNIIDKRPKKEPLKPYTNCQEIVGMFKNPKQYQISSLQLKEKYNLIKELGGANSGAKVFIVTPSSHPQTKLVLKTLPDPGMTASAENNENVRESFFSCKMSNMKANEYLPASLKAGDFFPTFYDVGIVDRLDPFREPIGGLSLKPIPFIVMEYIEGMTFIDFIEQPAVAKKIFGFSLEDAPPNFLKSILWQMAVALLNADRSFGFRHADLHPGNVMISKSTVKLMLKKNGKSVPYRGPKIKIIDLGSGFDKEFKASNIEKLLHKPLKGREKRLFDYENAHKSIVPKKFRQNKFTLKLMSYSFERDIRSLNFYIQVFKKRLKSNNARYCDTYKQCLDVVESL